MHDTQIPKGPNFQGFPNYPERQHSTFDRFLKGMTSTIPYLLSSGPSPVIDRNASVCAYRSEFREPEMGWPMIVAAGLGDAQKLQGAVIGILGTRKIFTAMSSAEFPSES